MSQVLFPYRKMLVTIKYFRTQLLAAEKCGKAQKRVGYLYCLPAAS
jgi:hypothetical protein